MFMIQHAAIYRYSYNTSSAYWIDYSNPILVNNREKRCGQTSWIMLKAWYTILNQLHVGYGSLSKE